MDALTRCVAVMVLATAGCGGAPPAAPPDDGHDTDLTGVTWGDEYEGVQDDADLEEALTSSATAATRARAGVSLDVLLGAADDAAVVVSGVRSVAASARYGHAGARYREGTYGRAGAVEVFDVSALQHFVVGAIRPTVGEGALIADARELGSPSVRASPLVSSLRTAPSSSLWGSVLGGAATIGAGPARVMVALWHPHDDDSTWTAWSGIEWTFARTRVGFAYGQTAQRPDGAVSVVASRSFQSAFVAVETARAGSNVACAARVVAGENAAWRASFAAGAAASPETPIGTAQRDRRMAVLERRDSWRGLGSRWAASSVVRRDGPSEQRRRRVDWALRARIDEGARVEGGVRFTENSTTEAPSLLHAGEFEEAGEWRARVALRVRERPSVSMEVEHMFRIDVIRLGDAPGVAATWRGALQRGPVECAVQASAWGLKPGQLGHLGRSGVPGSGAFTTISGVGSDLSMVARVGVGSHAGIAAQWRRHASGEEAVRVGASLRW